MTQLYEELAKRAQDLSPEERALLAQSILESIDHEAPGDVRAAWDEEIARRVAAYEAGEAVLVSGEEVFEQARRLTR